MQERGRYYIFGTVMLKNGPMMVDMKVVLSAAVGTADVMVITHFDTDAALYCSRE